MTFVETFQAIENCSDEYDQVITRCCVFSEASMNEYETNLQEANLKVIKESGTPDDLAYLESQAADGLIGRITKTIKKMVEAFIKWVKESSKALKDFLNDKKTKIILEKSDKAIKADPELKSKKVEIPDYQRAESVCDKHLSMIEKKIAMFKAGKFTKNDADDIANIEKGFKAEYAVAAAATIAISATVVVAAIEYCKKSHEKLEKDAEKENTIDIDPAKTEPTDATIIMGAEKLRQDIIKAKGTVLSRTVNKGFNALRNLVQRTGDVPIPDNINKKVKISKMEESTTYEKEDDCVTTEESMDDLEVINQILSESTDTVDEESVESELLEDSNVVTAEEYLESMEAELFGDTTEVEESADDKVYLTAEEYLESMENELFGDTDVDVLEESEGTEVTAEEYLEYMEAELFNDTDDEVLEENEGTEVTAEEYLQMMESELFGDEEEVTTESDDITDEEEITPEAYLESLEAELFGDNE